MYQIIKEESPASRLTVDEVRSLVQYVREKSGIVVLGGNQDDIDLNDLINAMMDASLDLLGEIK